MRTVIYLFPTALALLGLSLATPKALALVPPPDGGYPNFTTAEGTNALNHLTTGAANTAVGWFSLFSNAEGSFNTATGAGTLLFNTADLNTAFGAAALLFNTTGANNTAVGAAALLNNTTGFQNTATGAFALQSNTTGLNNTATGVTALFSNTDGDSNSAYGIDALRNNTTGNFNTANGFQALQNNTTGSNNIALGTQAGGNLTTGINNIDIGSGGVADESATTRIGQSGLQTRAFIAGIRGVTTGNMDAIPILIDSLGQLGTASSSRQFKKEIRPMDQLSEAILALKPVTFHYKSDSRSTPQFGLIAEEVAEVNPNLVVRDADGEVYTVRYDAVNAMLLNEFLKEHRKVEKLEATVADLAAELREVKAQVQADRAVLRVAVTNP